MHDVPKSKKIEKEFSSHVRLCILSKLLCIEIPEEIVIKEKLVGNLKSPATSDNSNFHKL